jgi:integrase
MPSIHKDPRGKSRFWYCCFTTAAGKRRMVSTRQEDEDKAKIICTRWAEAEGLVRNGQVTEQRIKEIFNDTLKSVGLREITSPTLQSWTKDWLGGKRKLSKASRLGYEQAVREFLGFLGMRQNVPIESITERDIDGFVDHLLKDGRSASTVNKLVRKYLSGAFEKARKLGKIRYNPVAATDPLPSDSTVKDVFSAGQVAKLVKAAKGDWCGAILLAYGSGARLQDVCNFRWDAIDTEQGILTFQERKTKKQAVVGLHPNFVDWLVGQQQTPEKSDAFLFPSLANRSGAGRCGLGAEFDKIMTRAGVEGRVLKERNGKGRKVRSLTFHSFRHTAASSVFNSEAIKEIQRRVTNHARGGVLDKYTHADLDLIRQAVALIPRLPKDE